MTLEQRWDLIWPLACAVSAAVERYDETELRSAMWIPRRDTLMHMCRQLKKAVDHISPDSETEHGGTR